MQKSIFDSSSFFWNFSAFGQKPPLTPAWAFSHIVWEDETNTQSGALSLVDSYFEHKISGGALSLTIHCQPPKTILNGAGIRNARELFLFWFIPMFFSSKVLHVPDNDGVEYHDYSVSYNEKTGSLVIDNTVSEKYTVHLRNEEKTKSVSNSFSWSYDTPSRTLYLHAEGKDVGISVNMP